MLRKKIRILVEVASLKRIFEFYLSIISLIFFASNAEAIDVSAKYHILMDYDTREILSEKDSLTPTAPSSMSKLMTTYIIFERLKNKEANLADEVLVSKEAWQKGGSRMFIQVDTKVKIEDLILGMVVQSGNDATVAIAEFCAGSESAFVELMNDKAKELGLQNSHFVNATGWPDEGHVMSTHDIAMLSKRIMDDFPEYYHYFSQKEFFYNNIKQYNRNNLLNSEPGVDGLKTGRTDIAGYGLAVSAKKEGRRLIVVVNGCDTNSAREQDSKTLLGYGFNSFINVDIAKLGEVLAKANLHNGRDKIIPLIANSDLLYTAKRLNSSKINVHLLYKDPILAPVRQNDIIGKLVIEGVREEPISLDILADRDYEEASIMTKILRKFAL
jgi:D-alanyl-D-alanine carboxypeptidase (penicillin-binding protein 5/6)